MNFDVAIERILGHEGGYVNNPSDPGGETQWGISKRSYPSLAIKSLTRDEAKEIYRRDFWRRIHGEEMYDGIAFQALDFAVNSGVETAVRKLQRAAGVADDGIWGPITQRAVAAKVESDLIMLFAAERLEYWASLSSFAVFGRGWVRRAAANLRYGAEDS